MTRYSDTRDEPSVWKAIGVFVGVFVVVVGIAIGVWVFKVETSDIKGRGDVTIQNNSGTNRINAQAYFEQLDGKIKGFGPQLTQQIALLHANPGDPMTVTNYQGLYNTCVKAVNDYNATAQQTTFKNWLTYDLPQSHDVTSDCPTAPTADLAPPATK